MSNELPPERFMIYVGSEAIDVVAHYRGRGFASLPPIPTMTGAEIRSKIPNLDPCYRLAFDPPDVPGEFQPLRYIADGEAVGLRDGMRFALIPPTTY